MFLVKQAWGTTWGIRSQGRAFIESGKFLDRGIRVNLGWIGISYTRHVRDMGFIDQASNGTEEG